jgi:hypothetical protein
MERAPSKDLFRQAMNGKEVKLVMAGFRREYDKKGCKGRQTEATMWTSDKVKTSNEAVSHV